MPGDCFPERQYDCPPARIKQSVYTRIRFLAEQFRNLTVQVVNAFDAFTTTAGSGEGLSKVSLTTDENPIAKHLAVPAALRGLSLYELFQFNNITELCIRCKNPVFFQRARTTSI